MKVSKTKVDQNNGHCRVVVLVVTHMWMTTRTRDHRELLMTVIALPGAVGQQSGSTMSTLHLEIDQILNV